VHADCGVTVPAHGECGGLWGRDGGVEAERYPLVVGDAVAFDGRVSELASTDSVLHRHGEHAVGISGLPVRHGVQVDACDRVGGGTERLADRVAQWDRCGVGRLERLPAQACAPR
jgi:hypothetical protein